MDIFLIKRNDLQPAYPGQAVDSSGAAIDLNGATVVCTMIDRATGTQKITRSAATITAAESGEFEYRWQEGDTDTAGTYYIEFEVTPLNGGKFTVPAEKTDAIVMIAEDLDGV